MLDPIDFSIYKFIDCIEDDLWQQVQVAGESCRYKKGSYVERHGELATHMSVIKSGLIRLELNSVDGSRFNMSILGNGSSFGETALFLDLPVQFDAFCETDSELLRLPMSAVDQLFSSNGHYGKALAKLAHARVHTLLGYIGNSLNKSLESRAANLLVMMLNESKEHLTIRCRQADLANALGVSRVSLGKALNTLKSIGLIELGYGKIVILSLSELKSLAK